MNASRRLSIKIPASSTPSNLNIVATEFNLKLKVNEAQSESQAHLDFKQSQHTFFNQMFIARTGFLNSQSKQISFSAATYPFD